ncbi:DUF2147 domain-containing protein (plasmid) [Shinella yambaruensis]|uniref:DUF2147 domain-containing protein n=1 Tax=Shinella yambaruensis TaxID=415996 RepID=UPI003D7BF930
MRIEVLTAFSAIMLTAAMSHAQQSVDPSGVWLRDDGNARVRIAPCGSNICATNLWIRDTSKGEEVGDRLIMSLQPKSQDSLFGTAFDEKRERTYSITVQVSDNVLLTRGCILGGVLCKNVRWQSAR